MLSTKNNGNLTFGLVDVPQVIDMKNGKIVKFRAAVDRAGRKGGEVVSGYFDITYFARDGDPNAKFVLSQIEKENFGKGTRLSTVFELVHDQYEKDGKPQSRISLEAHTIDYAVTSAPKKAEEAEATVPLPNSF